MSIPFLTGDDLPPGEAREAVAPAPGQPAVRRILCGNAGPLTFRGTNTWLIGRGEVTLLDPGPEDAAHRAAILRATRGERIARILVSHTHLDHSEGAPALAAATGAPVLAFGAHPTPPEAGGMGADHGFRPDALLAEGDAVEGEGWRLRALHTPGHCANHLCFVTERPGLLFSADLAMSWSTSVVSPPDGDMADYMRSLARIAARDDRLMLPGHGPVLPQPRPFLAALIRHREAREAKVLAALRAAGTASAEDLVPPVYGPSLDPRLVRGAARSLLAHLLKLVAEGRARREGGGFRATPG
ncbi:Hydroxyacylglutathione hydrolase [Roseomonas mucosa]|uniref:Hydroxyacylglutathione hydrolase n=1 Tax=Roseomonas mucosa TaxID=207340 RepID=A0A379N3Y4_9PROT|nr:MULTISPECIES: MBL fold metallo-hydrolase [Roseomonas]MBS5904953.1 MBL fold metallo-hydrolase [Acetobacteraceae bacterium]MCG7353692.1 MBL fold metallo-hydrolase [Roseomonas mucosa]MCG7357151.1 MBL fold metallo-hydrolase [Roseomonas mucosa]MDT8291543.1 MBL fold metallo-hydrolase [Roseomonas mucosa]MDT8295711.1 MBL fold metallo-hydrolase [Roseomonas mucosa]